MKPLYPDYFAPKQFGRFGWFSLCICVDWISFSLGSFLLLGFVLGHMLGSLVKTSFFRSVRTDFRPPLIRSHNLLWFMAQAQSAQAINRRGKRRISVNCSADREDEVSKIFLIPLYCVSDGFGDDFCVLGTASNFWRTSKAKQVNLAKKSQKHFGYKNSFK